MLVTLAGAHILNRINRNAVGARLVGTPITSRSHATVSPAGIKPECTTVAALFYCAACIAGTATWLPLVQHKAKQFVLRFAMLRSD